MCWFFMKKRDNSSEQRKRESKTENYTEFNWFYRPRLVAGKLSEKDSDVVKFVANY